MLGPVHGLRRVAGAERREGGEPGELREAGMTSEPARAAFDGLAVAPEMARALGRSIARPRRFLVPPAKFRARLVRVDGVLVAVEVFQRFAEVEMPARVTRVRADIGLEDGDVALEF